MPLWRICTLEYRTQGYRTQEYGYLSSRAKRSSKSLPAYRLWAAVKRTRRLPQQARVVFGLRRSGPYPDGYGESAAQARMYAKSPLPPAPHSGTSSKSAHASPSWGGCHR